MHASDRFSSHNNARHKLHVLEFLHMISVWLAEILFMNNMWVTTN
jgi:hypothetical protein